MQQLAPGSVFANAFRVVRPLSQGGMGSVYVVEHLATGTQRALKLMHPQLVSDATLRARFVQEARIGARINSDHVVEVLDAGIDAQTGMPWLLMELLRGETLAELLARSGPIPARVVRMIFSQLCHALGAAHAASIVHRDLKPENIFLETPRREGVDFTVKVLDFGIAKVVADASTNNTAAIGTPTWMAPEQTESRGTIGPQADVWALGLIAYTLLTGRPYWNGLNGGQVSQMALMREMLFDALDPASQRAAQYGAGHLIPRGFDAFFARCVVREPHLRFADARELRAHLDAALDESASVAPVTPYVAPPMQTTERTMPMPEPEPPPPRSAPSSTWLAFAGVALLAIIAGGIWAIRAGRDPYVAPTTEESAAPLTPKKFVPPKPVEPEAPTSIPSETATAPEAAPTPTPTPKPTAAPTPTPTPTPTSTSTSTSSDPPDKSALKSSLSSVSYKDCGSGGPGKVSVVYAPTGKVVSSTLTSGEYDAATKACVVSRFKKASSIPPFAGGPLTVGWSISL